MSAHLIYFVVRVNISTPFVARTNSVQRYEHEIGRPEESGVTGST